MQPRHDLRVWWGFALTPMRVMVTFVVTKLTMIEVNLTEFERDLLLQFQGPHKAFQAPGGSASFEQHEEWRNTVYGALTNLEDEGFLDITSSAKPSCGRHGKCKGLSIAAICRLTEEGEEILAELRAGVK